MGRAQLAVWLAYESLKHVITYLVFVNEMVPYLHMTFLLCMLEHESARALEHCSH